jgi:acetyltransferase-like isoleucine patch superfamily enzyme
VFKAKRGDALTRAVRWVHRQIAVGRNVTLAPEVHIGLGSVVWAPRRLSIGEGTFIGRDCSIMADGSIGRWVGIANKVGIIGRYDHDAGAVGVPIAEAPWIGDPGYCGPGHDLEVVIGDDAWVGYGAIVVTGVTVGRGAIVGAGAVVVTDVAPYAIVAGNPARVVGRRFSPEDAARHEQVLAQRTQAGPGRRR